MNGMFKINRSMYLISLLKFGSISALGYVMSSCVYVSLELSDLKTILRILKFQWKPSACCPGAFKIDDSALNHVSVLVSLVQLRFKNSLIRSKFIVKLGWLILIHTGLSYLNFLLFFFFNGLRLWKIQSNLFPNQVYTFQSSLINLTQTTF